VCEVCEVGFGFAQSWQALKSEWWHPLQITRKIGPKTLARHKLSLKGPERGLSDTYDGFLLLSAVQQS
jgi:hypothetical protein